MPNKVDEPRVVDPTATEPEDWDEEEDGEWEAPVRHNLKFHQKTKFCIRFFR
jgi:hypothetical protein